MYRALHELGFTVHLTRCIGLGRTGATLRVRSYPIYRQARATHIGLRYEVKVLSGAKPSDS